ncbi:tetraspanin-2A-like [Contarinia nasturtii]|uniref:tetraspanin-2A-like n=1 Tax=Contarinia nasturtii TaxID=265458 RepID=UPI0012D473F6|nr:tetraspanin-2A-like [Contarinia nasturtii]
MAGKGNGQGANMAKLENQISTIKYSIFCFNIIAWIIGAGMFIATVWIRAEKSFEEWIQILDIYVYYVGIYILIAASVIILIVSFLGCCSALMEHTQGLFLFIGTQCLAFIIHVAGSAVLLDYSTLNSSIQPFIRDSMRRLIMSSSTPQSTTVLKMIQENIGCCGADGSNDYIIMRQPLPSTCRDTVTGNAFFHGCVDELTWLLEDKSGWVAGLAMTLAFIQVINVVLSLVLIQALKKEEDEARNYRQ